MSRIPSLTQIKTEMRKRLMAEPQSLRLDSRIDESPEDVFAAMADRGLRDAVVTSLDQLIHESFKCSPKPDSAAFLRLLQRALRLCDTLEAVEVKPSLKVIVLEDDATRWGGVLGELKELAARALLGLPKSKGDLRFWIITAEQFETSLPYALNAIIEINLTEGFRVFWRLFKESNFKIDHPLVDWKSILEDAAATHGENKVAEKLEEAFYEVNNLKSAEYYERFLRHLRLSQFSRQGKRSLKDVEFEYSLPASQSFTFEAKAGDLDSLRLTPYQGTNDLREDAIGAEQLPVRYDEKQRSPVPSPAQSLYRRIT
jgi:hypothetical protein